MMMDMTFDHERLITVRTVKLDYCSLGTNKKKYQDMVWTFAQHDNMIQRQ